MARCFQNDLKHVCNFQGEVYENFKKFQGHPVAPEIVENGLIWCLGCLGFFWVQDLDSRLTKDLQYVLLYQNDPFYVPEQVTYKKNMAILLKLVTRHLQKNAFFFS